MSKYTTDLGYRIAMENGVKDPNTIKDIKENCRLAGTAILGEYPIFNESYRDTLNTNVLLHYYTHEIGFETVGLFKLKIGEWFSLNMPYYNKLYESELLKIDPFNDVNETTTHNEVYKGETRNTDNAKGNTSTTKENYSTNKYSDTPQGSINNLINDKYLTNATLENSNETTSTNNSVSNESKGNNKNEGEWVTNRKGKTSSISYSKLLKEYRSSFINIDKMIIEQLSDYFMLLW